MKLKDLAQRVQREELPEGVYCARITAWAGATNITAQPPAGDTFPNVTALFWIQDTGDEGPGATAAITKDTPVASLLQARCEVQWDLLAAGHDPWALPASTQAWDGPTDDKKAVGGVCTVRYGRRTFRIRLATLLRRIEGVILAKPDSFGAMQVDLSQVATSPDVPLSARPGLSTLVDDDPFLAARVRLFTALRGEDGEGTVETADLLALRDEILAYAREYATLVRDAERDVTRDARLWAERVGFAAIDTVRVALPGLSEQASMAILLAPTHPLRLLWSLQLALLGESWLREAYRRGQASALTSELRHALQGNLQPANLPPVLFDARRVGYLQAGAIAPGWDVYLPAGVADKGAALSRLSRALSGSGGGERAGASVSASRELRDRALRYLRQHPYVGQLQLNVFNAGDGAIVADLLSGLDEHYPDLRYDVRLFSHDAVRGDLGAALDRLVNPEATVGEGAEKYSQGSAYALHPTLSYSKNRVDDFLDAPETFRAHLSILMDVFRPRVDVAAPFAAYSQGILHGLAHDETVRRLGERGAFAWERQVIAGPSREIEGVCFIQVERRGGGHGRNAAR